MLFLGVLLKVSIRTNGHLQGSNCSQKASPSKDHALPWASLNQGFSTLSHTLSALLDLSTSNSVFWFFVFVFRRWWLKPRLCKSLDRTCFGNSREGASALMQFPYSWEDITTYQPLFQLIHFKYFTPTVVFEFKFCPLFFNPYKLPYYK